MEFLDRKRRVEFGYFVLILIMSIQGVIHGIASGAEFFWDYHVYQRAIADFLAGQNPYGLDRGLLPFVYPPLFLHIFAIGAFPLDYALLIGALGAIAAHEWITNTGKLPLALAGFLAGGGVIAVISGNFSVFAHFALIALSCVLLQSPRPRQAEVLFIAVAILASLFKFYFAAYALVPLVGRRRSSAFVIVLTVVALAYIAQPIVDPRLWTGFTAALGEQVIARNDAGFTLMALVETPGGWARPALALAHEAIVIGAFFFVVTPYGPKKLLQTGKTAKIFLYFLIATIIFTNPRLKEYDSSVLFYCIFSEIYHLRRQNCAYPGVFFCILPALIFAMTQIVAIIWQTNPGLLPENSPSIVPMVAAYALFLHLAWTLRGVARTRCGPPAQTLEEAGKTSLTTRDILVRYVLFAFLAGAANLSSQHCLAVLGPTLPLFASVLAGTVAGFALKYLLDKLYVFRDSYDTHAAEARKVVIYGLTSIGTTALFWAAEIGAWQIWQTGTAKYIGGALGLAVGYWVKYRLDRTFAFARTGALARNEP